MPFAAETKVYDLVVVATPLETGSIQLPAHVVCYSCRNTHTQTQTQTHTHTLTLTQTNTHTHTDTHTHTTLYLCFCFDCVCECNVCFLHRHSPHHPLTLADPHDTTAAIKSCAAEDADDGCDVCGG